MCNRGLYQTLFINNLLVRHLHGFGSYTTMGAKLWMFMSLKKGGSLCPYSLLG